MALTSRDKLLTTLSLTGGAPPPRYENESSDDVLGMWRNQGFLDDRSLEDLFGLERRETVSVNWSGMDSRTVVETEEDHQTEFRYEGDVLRLGCLPFAV